MKKYPAIGEELYSFTHESGLPVYVLPKKGFGKSFCIFATKFGSVHNTFKVDGEDLSVPDGIAHFLEHKLFEEQEGNVFERFSALGASANAYTSFDMTGYLFSATANVYEALEVLIRFVQNPYFTDENVEKEKGIIGQEIDMYRDDPSWNCFFEGVRAMYEKHPVRIDIAGSQESIAKIDKDLLYKCYNAFYSPKNMLLFVGGDVEPEKVKETVSKAALCLPSPEICFYMPREPEGILKGKTEAKFPVSMPMMSLSFKESPLSDPVFAEAAYGVLGSLLFSKSTSLYEELYAENLMQDSLSHGYTQGHGYAFFQIDCESSNPDKVRERIFAYIEKVRKEGISEEDFERVKKSAFGRAVRLMDDVEKIGHNFVPLMFLGGDFLAYPDVIRSLTLADVTSLLEKGFSEEKSVLSVVRP